MEAVEPEDFTQTLFGDLDRIEQRVAQMAQTAERQTPLPPVTATGPFISEGRIRHRSEPAMFQFAGWAQ